MSQDPSQLKSIMGLEASLTPQISAQLCHLSGQQLVILTVHHLRFGPVNMLFPLDGISELISCLEQTLTIAQSQQELAQAELGPAGRVN